MRSAITEGRPHGLSGRKPRMGLPLTIAGRRLFSRGLSSISLDGQDCDSVGPRRGLSLDVRGRMIVGARERHGGRMDRVLTGYSRRLNAENASRNHGFMTYIRAARLKLLLCATAPGVLLALYVSASKSRR